MSEARPPPAPPRGTHWEVDGDTGELIAVSDGTGKAVDYQFVAVEPGTQLRSPAELEALERRRAQQQKQGERRFYRDSKTRANSQLGPFVVVRFPIPSEVGQLPFEVRPETIARLVYLSTYLHCNGTLMSSRRRPLTKREALNALGLSRSLGHTFWREVVDGGFIIEEPDGRLSMPSQMFFRGRFKASGEQFGLMPVYCNQYRAAFRGAATAEHRYLGYLIQLLPWLNLKTNVLCQDLSGRLAENEVEISPASVPDFCKLVGLSAGSAGKIRRVYDKLSFPVDGVCRRVCSVVRDKSGREVMCLNSRLMFAGSNWEYAERRRESLERGDE